MFVFSDLTTLVLAIYVGCHLYMTISTFVSKTCDSIATRVDSVIGDFHTIAKSIENLSLSITNLNHTFTSASRTYQRTNTQLLYLIYGMVGILVMQIFRIDLQSSLSSLIPMLTRLVTAYMRGAASGTNDEYGMNEEMRTMMMQTMMENMGRPATAMPSDRFVPSFTNTHANYNDLDSESDITEILENVEIRVPVNTPTQNSPTLVERHNGDSNDNSLGNVSELSNLVVVNGNTEIASY